MLFTRSFGGGHGPPGPSPSYAHGGKEKNLVKLTFSTFTYVTFTFNSWDSISHFVYHNIYENNTTKFSLLGIVSTTVALTVIC